MKSSLWLALLLTFIPVPLLAQGDAERYESVQLFNRANDKSAKGDYQGALADYALSVKKFPGYYDAHARSAELHFKLQEYTKAIADYRQMLRLYANDGGAYQRIGESYFALQDYPKAIEAFSRLVSFNESSPGPRKLRAKVYIEIGDYAKALADYQVLLDQDPEIAAQAYFESGKIYQRLDRFPLALEAYKQVTLLNVEVPGLLAQQGFARYQNGRNLPAISDCTEALKTDPKNVLAYYGRANANFYLGLKSEAQADYSAAASLAPKNEFDFQARAIARLNTKDYPGAVADYTEAIALHPPFAAAYFGRGQSKLAAGDRQGAIADLNQAAKLYGDHSDPENQQKVQTVLQKIGS
jgi:tetratricopeptide (TPR) repeat protein